MFAQPLHGKEVSVAVRVKDNSIFAETVDGYETFSLRGVVCRPNVWTPSTSFVLQVKPDHPSLPSLASREIDLSLVTDLTYTDGSEALTRAAPKVEAALSKTVAGSGGAIYIVTRALGRTVCSCPGFGFRKSCKHTANFETLVEVSYAS